MRIVFDLFGLFVTTCLTCLTLFGSRRGQGSTHLISFYHASLRPEKSFGSELLIGLVTNITVNEISSQPGAANETKSQNVASVV